MKLKEFVEKPLEEALKELELVKVETHTDDEGNVKAVELKYVVKIESDDNDIFSPKRRRP